MKKLMIVLSLVFVASCGDDNETSILACPDPVPQGTTVDSCVNSSDADAVAAQNLKAGQRQCTKAATDNTEAQTCVRTDTDKTRTVDIAGLDTCATETAAANSSCVTVTTFATPNVAEQTAVNEQTVGSGQSRCRQLITGGGTAGGQVCVE